MSSYNELKTRIKRGWPFSFHHNTTTKGQFWLQMISTFCARGLGRVARQTPFMPRSVINTAIKSICWCRLEVCVREIDTWMLLNKLKLIKTKLNVLWNHLYTVLDLLCHIFMFVMRERCLHQKWVTLEFFSTNLWVWFLRCDSNEQIGILSSP